MKHLTVTLSPVVARAERQIDDVLANSFPASDPPSWTPGGAETNPTNHPGTTSSFVTRARTLTYFFRPVAALLGALGLALLVPILVVLLPLALTYRLVLEATRWPTWLRRFTH